MTLIKQERIMNMMSSSRLYASAGLPAKAINGRGTQLAPPNRFETISREAFEDGWPDTEDEPPPPRTTLLRDATRRIIIRNDSPDLPFEQSANPYRGCEHGCIYCFARPSHAYLGFSAGLDFETKIICKPDAARLLEKELSRPGYKAAPLVLGSNTDPYQPVERSLAITRALLEVLERFNNPVAIVTKSTGILRDMDILARMAAKGQARVHISLTTQDARLSRLMEPRAASPARRLAAISSLTEAGIPVTIMAAPLIPGLNDAELESLLEAGVKAGASAAAMSLVRLPHEVAELFAAWLQTNLPERAAHVLSLIRQCRGGQLNDPRFHHRFAGTGAIPEMLHQRFERVSRALGLAGVQSRLNCASFAIPGGASSARQLTLL
jgi:DNA repair photolyase